MGFAFSRQSAATARGARAIARRRDGRDADTPAPKPGARSPDEMVAAMVVIPRARRSRRLANDRGRGRACASSPPRVSTIVRSGRTNKPGTRFCTSRNCHSWRARERRRLPGIMLASGWVSGAETSEIRGGRERVSSHNKRSRARAPTLLAAATTSISSGTIPKLPSRALREWRVPSRLRGCRFAAWRTGRLSTPPSFLNPHEVPSGYPLGC